MPVLFDSEPGAGQRDTQDSCVTIGLINNMSDEALKPTERQFISLLQAASEGIEVRLTLYTLPGIARSAAFARDCGRRYGNMDDLWRGQLDGLIVTGREPLAPRLQDEPYWESFTRLLGWARENAHSTIWSCLAAHAAILHMDGIERVKRGDKLFGIFDCEQTSRHGLTTGAPATMRMPHSRWNGIPPEYLIDRGYEVLTGGAEVGVDTFIKQENKLFVFFQGHPEYARDTLLREYRRDVGRFLHGDTAQYPSIPCNYFDESAASSLAALRNRAISTRHPELLAEVAAELDKSTIENTWNASATTLYRNWLKYLCTQKEAVRRSTRVRFAADLAPVS